MSDNLKTEYGMLAFSADAGSRANISPFVSGFHLEVGGDDTLRMNHKVERFLEGTARVGYTRHRCTVHP